MTNTPPEADAGLDQTVTVGTPVTLSGAGSTDTDGIIESYSWVQVSGPPVTLTGTGATRTFTPTVEGEYVFGLTVTDNGGVDPETVPEAPVSLQGTPGNTTIALNWLPPSGGTTPTSYTVTANGQTVDVGNVTSYTLTGLTSNTVYVISVRAWAAAGAGPAAQFSTTTTTPPPPDTVWGEPGNRPVLLFKPDASNTGARYATTQTMNGDQALLAALAQPIESDGRRHLRRVNITSAIRFNSASHHSIVFEDCTIGSNPGGGGIYMVRCFWADGGAQPAGPYPEFRFCTIRGGSSSTMVGGYVRFLRCNMSQGLDIFKPFGPTEIYGCWAHDTWHADGAHCDVVQIVSGATGYVYWNNFEGFNDINSPTNPGYTSSGVLQMGTMTNNTGPMFWTDNWFNGAHYTIRGVSASETPYTTNLTFRRNKFGRGYRDGPVASISQYDFDNTNVYEDTGLPVTG